MRGLPSWKPGFRFANTLAVLIGVMTYFAANNSIIFYKIDQIYEWIDVIPGNIIFILSTIFLIIWLSMWVVGYLFLGFRPSRVRGGMRAKPLGEYVKHPFFSFSLFSILAFGASIGNIPLMMAAMASILALIIKNIAHERRVGAVREGARRALFFPPVKQVLSEHSIHVRTKMHVATVLAILSGGVWAIYTFIYEKSFLPYQMPPFVTMDMKVERLAPVDGLVPLQVQMTITNDGNTRVEIFAAWYNASATRVSGVSNSNKYLNDTLIAQADMAHFSRRTIDLYSEPLSSGPIVNGKYFLECGEKYQTKVLLYIPSHYDYCDLNASAWVRRSKKDDMYKEDVCPVSWFISGGELQAVVMRKHPGSDVYPHKIRPVDLEDPKDVKYIRRKGIVNAETNQRIQVVTENGRKDRAEDTEAMQLLTQVLQYKSEAVSEKEQLAEYLGKGLVLTAASIRAKEPLLKKRVLIAMGALMMEHGLYDNAFAMFDLANRVRNLTVVEYLAMVSEYEMHSKVLAADEATRENGLGVLKKLEERVVDSGIVAGSFNEVEIYIKFAESYLNLREPDEAIRVLNKLDTEMKKRRSDPDLIVLSHVWYSEQREIDRVYGAASAQKAKMSRDIKVRREHFRAAIRHLRNYLRTEKEMNRKKEYSRIALECAAQFPGISIPVMWSKMAIRMGL